MDSFASFDFMTNWFYSDGNVLMMLCKLVVFLFVMEVFAYIVSIISNATKTALK